VANNVLYRTSVCLSVCLSVCPVGSRSPSGHGRIVTPDFGCRVHATRHARGVRTPHHVYRHNGYAMSGVKQQESVSWVVGCVAATWLITFPRNYVGVTKRFRTGRLERELQTVQLSTTKRSYIAALWVSQMSFATITLFIASQRVNAKSKCIFHYRFSPETFGYALVYFIQYFLTNRLLQFKLIVQLQRWHKANAVIIQYLWCIDPRTKEPYSIRTK
jgi:hypothetical protein